MNLPHHCLVPVQLHSSPAVCHRPPRICTRSSGPCWALSRDDVESEFYSRQGQYGILKPSKVTRISVYYQDFLCTMSLIMCFISYRRLKQETQLMLTNPRDALRSQSRSPNIVPFYMLGIVSSCAIVTLSLRRAIFTIFDFKKCHDLEIQVSLVRGHSRSFDRLHMISY